MPDAITLLKDDHRTVERLFKRFESLGDNAHKSKQQVVAKIIEELSMHSSVEEQILYPAARESLADDSAVLEDLEEHHIVKWTLSELMKMSPTDERYDAKVKVLTELVRHHIQEEEEELFPTLRETWTRKRAQEVGDALAEAKKFAPTKPHPRAPDEPPANVIAGATAAATDRVVDLARGVVKKATGGRIKI